MSAPPSTRAQNPTNHLYYGVGDTLLTHGHGVYVYDASGASYLDAASATFNLSLGYSHPEIVETVREQAGKLIHASSSFQAEAVNELVERLIEVAPSNLTRVHPKVSSGSAANEGAIKIAQYHTGGRDVITQFRSHLGQTMYTLSLSGNAFRQEPFESHLPGALKVPDPHCGKCFYGQRRETCGLMCVERIPDFIEFAGSGRTACVLIEPISGNGGNIVAPDGYLGRLKQICDDIGVPLIFDEIQTGFGRTGHMFAADYFGVAPSMITFAKGLGGSGLQVAGILTEERYAGMPAEHHSFTYGGNVLAAAAGAKTIEVIRRPGFLENVQLTGQFLLDGLHDLADRHATIAEIRGVGLMIGFDIVDADGRDDVGLTHRIVAIAKDEGLLLRTSRYGRGNTIKIRPPLVITIDDCVRLLSMLDRALAKAVAA